MILIYAVLLVVGYAMAASWAVSAGGRPRLWLTAAGTLLLIAAISILLGWHHAVPSLARVLLYAMGFAGPVVVVPTVLLSLPGAPGAGWARRLPLALAGACVGAICGWAVAVFGLGAW